MWYSPGTCGGDGGDWETRGWWNLNPGANVHTNVWTDNRYFCYLRRGLGRSKWAGPYGAEVSINAFDGCIDIGTSVSDGPSPYFDVGFRLVDAGWWFLTDITYTINLV